MRLGWHTIRDTHNYGALTVSGVIIKSSNVGSAKLRCHFPKETLPSFFNRAGFGKRSVFPGKLWFSTSCKQVKLFPNGTMAYGYGLNATILQLAQGYAMLANHGVKCL